MKENLIDIVNSIVSCGKARKGTGIQTIARIHCLHNGAEETFWFTPEPMSRSLYGIDGIHKYGRFVPKNSNIAIKLQKSKLGSSFHYDQKITVRRHQEHHILLENRADFQNQTIGLAGDEILYQYRNIYEFLDALQQNKDDIVEVESKIRELEQEVKNLKNDKQTAHQRGQITKTIKKYLEEYRILTQQQEDLKNITIYIRKQGEMRYSLIVDTVQTRIKSQNLFDGKTVIINGGPGTGKTTTMIHRLAYLTDKFAINEDEKDKTNNFKLTSYQRKVTMFASANDKAIKV